MALALPYTLVDGVVFLPAEYNKNLYSTALTGADEQGFFSWLNGGPTTVDLEAGFSVEREHVLPGQAVRPSSAQGLQTQFCFSDFFELQGGADLSWVSLAEKSDSFYLPYAVSQCFISANLYFVPWLVVYRATDAEPQTATEFGSITLRMSLDGVGIVATERPMALSALANDTTAGTDGIVSRESRAAMLFNPHHLAEGLAAGPHVVGLQALVGGGWVELSNVPQTLNGSTTEHGIRAVNRAIFGVSNLVVVPLL